MRRRRNALAAAFAALTLVLAGCGKSAGEGLVGVWRVVDERLTTTVTSVPDGWDLNGSHTELADYGEDPYPETWTFSGGGILTVTPAHGDTGAVSGPYSVDGGSLLFLRDGDTVRFDMLVPAPGAMNLSTRWYEFYTAGKYTVCNTHRRTLNLEKM